VAGKFALDIFKLLGRITNKKSGDIYPTLTDDEKKGFSPLVVMRWLSGTSDPAQILALNTFANKSIFPLAKHPHLLMRTLQACSTNPGRVQWLGIKSGTKNPLTRQVIMDYFEYSTLELKKMDVWPTEAEILEMAEELGWQKDEIAKLKKEFKA
jgi:hypothetical protein